MALALASVSVHPALDNYLVGSSVCYTVNQMPDLESARVPPHVESFWLHVSGHEAPTLHGFDTLNCTGNATELADVWTGLSIEDVHFVDDFIVNPTGRVYTNSTTCSFVERSLPIVQPGDCSNGMQCVKGELVRCAAMGYPDCECACSEYECKCATLACATSIQGMRVSPAFVPGVDRPPLDAYVMWVAVIAALVCIIAAAFFYKVYTTRKKKARATDEVFKSVVLESPEDIRFSGSAMAAYRMSV